MGKSASLVWLLVAACLLALFPAAGTTGEPADPTSRARDYLAGHAASLGLRGDLGDLRPSYQRESLTGEHVKYQQTVNGVPVFGATVSVSLSKGESIDPVVRNRYSRGSPAQLPLTISPGDGLARAVRSVSGPQGGAEQLRAPELVYFPTQAKTLVPAWQIALRTEAPLGNWLVVVNATSGEVVFERNLLRFDTGQVFDPSPAQSNGGSPPAAHCDSAQNEAVMADEYFARELLDIDTGQDKLKGAWVDVTAPGIKGGYKPAGVADEPSRNYIYGCDDDRFEEVMVYYHLTRTQRKFQELGFTDAVAIVNRPVPAHAHFMAGCNAFFDPFNRGVHFGDFDSDDFFFGCPFSPPHYDSAEDADVIIHEYGHAVHDDQVPGWGWGLFDYNPQTWAMGEGFADFLAGVMNGNPCIGEYINFGEFACGTGRGLRYLQNNKKYPEGYNICGYDFDGDTIADDVEPHCAGQVWSGALWDLTEVLGGGAPSPISQDLTLTLVLESHFYLDQAASFNEAAAAICLVDKILYGGAHQAAITSTFANRGISTGSCATSDFPSFYIRAKHPWSGDLDINIKVGADVNAPLCTVDVADPDPQLAYPNVYFGYAVLTECADHLPPTSAQPWWLEVQDVAAQDVGAIEDFQLLLIGGTRCFSTDVPVAIPDAGPAVYVSVDCTAKIEPPPVPTPSPTPGPNAFGNVDCTGSINSIDALKVLRASSGLAVSQTEPCPDISIEYHVNGELQGDVDCNGSVNSIDALKLLRYASGLSVSQTDPCPLVGS